MVFNYIFVLAFNFSSFSSFNFSSCVSPTAQKNDKTHDKTPFFFFLSVLCCIGWARFDGVVNLCFGQVWMRGQAKHHGPQVASPARPMSPPG